MYWAKVMTYYLAIPCAPLTIELLQTFLTVVHMTNYITLILLLENIFYYSKSFIGFQILYLAES